MTDFVSHNYTKTYYSKCFNTRCPMFSLVQITMLSEMNIDTIELWISDFEFSIAFFSKVSKVYFDQVNSQLQIFVTFLEKK